MRCRFTGNTADASIEVRARRKAAEIVYSIRDNGAGFDMPHAQRLSAPLQRRHEDQEFEGGGIGLAIIQRIVGRWMLGNQNPPSSSGSFKNLTIFRKECFGVFTAVRPPRPSGVLVLRYPNITAGAAP